MTDLQKVWVRVGDLHRLLEAGASMTGFEVLPQEDLGALVQVAVPQRWVQKQGEGLRLTISVSAHT